MAYLMRAVMRTMNSVKRTLPTWFPYADLACATMAGAAWYLRPQWGPGPLVLVLAPWAVRWIVTGRPTRRTPLDVPLALFLATALLGVWTAYQPEVAWAKFWIIVGSVGIYYALANQPTTRHLRLFAALYALFGAAIVGYFLWTNNWIHGKAKIEALNRLGEAIQAALPPLSAHQMQPNVVGGLLAMIVPFQIAVLAGPWLKRAALWRGLAALALALTAFGLLMTTSRGAWLALALALGLWGLWAASARPIQNPKSKTRPEQGRRVPNRSLRFGTLLALAVLAGGLLLLFVPGGPRGLLALLPGQNQLPDRVSLWSRALALIQDAPFTGGGLGTFPPLDSAYAYPITSWVRYRVFIFVTNFHSHNLWLDVGVEQGLPGLAALLWIQVAFVFTAWRGRKAVWQEGADRWRRLLVEAALVSALVVALHALVDDVPYGSRAMLLFFVPLGLVVAALAPHPRPLSPRRREGSWAAVLALVPVVVIALGLAALVWRHPLTAAWQADLGAVAQAHVELAGYLDEGWSLEEARASGDLGRATAYFERALALDPAQPTANLRLGLIHLGRGEYGAAIPLLEEAFRRRPGLQAARQALAEAYLAAGRLEESASLWVGVDEAAAKLQWLARQAKQAGDEARLADVEWVVERLRYAQ
jgi:tetratricopeptide (TPR) repeat protein